MTYIAPLDLNHASPATAATLNAVKASIGMIPNLFATLAKAPSALNALLQINESNAHGQLSAKEREVIALAVSQVNGCQYCVSAHTLLAKGAGLSLQQTQAARSGSGNTPREAALAEFSQALVESRGQVDAETLNAVRQAGLSESDLLEVVANVAAMTLTNYANNLAKTAIDFPVIPLELNFATEAAH